MPHASPQWDLQDSLRPNSFQALASTHQTMKVNLCAPCPDHAPETTPATAPGSPLETQNPQLETSPPIDALADQSPNRTRNDQPQPGLAQATQPKTGSHPKSKREMSAKKAGDQEYIGIISTTYSQ